MGSYIIIGLFVLCIATCIYIIIIAIEAMIYNAKASKEDKKIKSRKINGTINIYSKQTIK